MAVKISDLPTASTIDDADILPIVQDNTTKKVTKSIFIDNVNDIIYNRHFEGSTDSDESETETILAAGDISTDDVFIVEYLGLVESGDLFQVSVGGAGMAFNSGLDHYSKVKIFHNGTEWRLWQYWSPDDSNPGIFDASAADLSVDGLELDVEAFGAFDGAAWDFTLLVRQSVQRGTVPSILE